MTHTERARRVLFGGVLVPLALLLLLACATWLAWLVRTLQHDVGPLSEAMVTAQLTCMVLMQLCGTVAGYATWLWLACVLLAWRYDPR